MSEAIRLFDTYDDQQLLQSIGDKRDRVALQVFYERFKHGLGSFIQKRVFEQRLVDEIYNDVMLTVWNKAASFRGDSSVATWVFAIAHRTCLNHVRKEIKHTDKQTDLDFDQMHDTKSVDNETENTLSDQLKSAMLELKESHKTVVELAYFHGYNLQEIAEITKTPVNTVKTRLFHARKKLRFFVEKAEKAERTEHVIRADRGSNET